MSKNSVAKKDNQISAKGAQELVLKVQEGMKIVSQGYLGIAPHVAKLYDCKGFKALGYQNYDDMCNNEFGMSHGTATGIRAVFKRFGSVDVNNNYTIPEKYMEWGYTKLWFFATDATRFENAGINPLEVFTPDMTIKEMKSTLSKALEDKAQKQEAEAIDTEAEEVSAEEATAEAQEAEAQDAEAQRDGGNEPNVFEILDNIIKEASKVKEMCEMANWLKPEKVALLDAITANTKEVKKLLKKQ